MKTERATPEGKSSPGVWVGDALVAPDEAAVSVFDHGLVTGDGCFEVLMARPGEVFALEPHMERLARSAAAMGIPVPTPGRVEAAIMAVAGTVREESILRVTWTAGRGPLSSARLDSEPTLVVAAQPLGNRAPSAEIAVVPWTRNPTGALSGVKSTSYGENVRALDYARSHGAGEALFLNTQGRVCEGTGSNIFVVSGDQVLTPPLSEGCLAGITRLLLIAVKQVTERPISQRELLDCNEAFLTSTTRGVQPISAIDGRALGTGPTTQSCIAAFSAIYDDPVMWSGKPGA